MIKRVRRAEIGLAEQDNIGLGDLRRRLFILRYLHGPLEAIDHGNDAVQPASAYDCFIALQALHDGTGIGQPGGLDQDTGKTRYLSILDLGEQIANGVDQVVANRAADTTVFKQQDVLDRRFHQNVIQPDLAEFVDDHRRRLHALLAD